MLIFFLPGIELGLRILGFRPYEITPYTIQSEPAFCLIPHPQLGFGLQPGSFDISVNQGPGFKARHGADSLRITPPDTLPEAQPEIWMMGCSYTYGMGVGEAQTFTALLQQKFPHYRFRNFGVPGYGTVQSYLQLKKSLAEGEKPALVVLNYADFHPSRNVLSPPYRKALFMGFQTSNEAVSQYAYRSRIPYVDPLAEGLEIRAEKWEHLYQNWPGRHYFSLINLGQDVSDYFREGRMRPREKSLDLILEMQALCQEAEIPFVVSLLTEHETNETLLTQLGQQGIFMVDMALDLREPGLNMLPYDAHPSARAHALYAAALSEAFHSGPLQLRALFGTDTLRGIGTSRFDGLDTDGQE